MLFKKSTLAAAGIAVAVIVAFAMIAPLAKFRKEAEDKSLLKP